MKRLFGLITAISLPLASLPLVNAKAVEQPVNLDDVVMNIGNNSTMTFRFKNSTEWGTYAELYKISLGEDIEHLLIPREVTASDGNSYVLRRVNTFKECKGEHTINTLDFSQASFLYEICDKAFSKWAQKGDKSCQFSIKSIIWNGATSLEIIGYYAFTGQSLSSSVGQETFNFLNTKLRYLGIHCFNDSCETNANKFDKIILPEAFKQSCHDTFNGESGTGPQFKYVIFGNKTGDIKLDAWGMPPLTDDSSAQIIVPHGTLATYKKIEYFEPADKAHASNMWYDDQHTGSLFVGAHVNMSGVDNVTGKSWQPWNGTALVNDCTMKAYGGPWDGFLSVNKNNQLIWEAGAPIGEYYYYVTAEKVDENGQLQVAIGNRGILTVIDAKVLDLPEYYSASSLYAGESDYINVSCYGPHAIMSWSVGFDLVNVPYAIANKVRFIDSPTGTKGYLKWDANLPEGIHKFQLQPKIYIAMCAPIYMPTSTITLAVDRPWIEGCGIKVRCGGKDESPKEIPSTGIELAVGDEYYVYSVVDPERMGGESVEPAISCTSAADSPTQTLEEGIYQYKLKTEKAGTYKFCFYQNQLVFADPQEYNPFYSDWVTVKVGTNVPTIATTDDYAQLPVSTETTGVILNLPISTKDDIIVTGDVKIEANSWMNEEMKLHIGGITAAPSTTDPKSIAIKVASDFLRGAYQGDIQITTTLKDTTTNEEWVCERSFTIVTTNNTSISYSGQPTIYVYENDGEKTILDPFEFIVNRNRVSEISDLQIEAQVVGDMSGYYKEKIKMEKGVGSNAAVMHIKDIAIPEGQKSLELDVNVVGTTNSYNSASTTIKVVIWNEFKFTSCPTVALATTGKSGKWSQDPIKATFNGKDETKISIAYTIDGYPQDNVVSIDDDGYVTWTDEIAQGEYQMHVNAQVTNNRGQTFSIDKYFVLDVIDDPTPPTPTPKNNTGLIVGCTVGGVAVAGGAATGTTIGIKKHKAKLTKK